MSDISEEDFEKLVEEFKPLDYAELLELLKELDKFSNWMKEVEALDVSQLNKPDKLWISIKDKAS